MMARTTRSYGRGGVKNVSSSLTPEEVMALLNMKQSRPKVGILGRLGSLFNVFETAPAVYKTLQTGNPLAGLGEYLGSAGRGLATAVTGQQYETEPKKTYKDVLKDYGGMKDRPGKIDLVDVLGLAGDIGLDPSTYLGVGTAGKLSKAGQAAQKTGIKTAQEVAEKTGVKLTREAAEKAGKEALAKLGEAGFEKAGRLSFAGRKLVDLPSAVAKPAKLFVDPLQSIAESKVGKKVGQAVKGKANEIGDLLTGTFKTGGTKAKDLLKAGKREISGAGTLSKIQSNELKKIAGDAIKGNETEFFKRIQRRMGANPEWSDELKKAYDTFYEWSSRTTKGTESLGLPVQKQLAYVPKIKTDVEEGVKVGKGASQIPKNLAGKPAEIKGFEYVSGKPIEQTGEYVLPNGKIIGKEEQLGMQGLEDVNNAIKKLDSKRASELAPLKAQLEADPNLRYKGNVLEPTLYKMGDIDLEEAAKVGINFETDLGQVTEKMLKDYYEKEAATRTWSNFAKLGSDTEEAGMVKFSSAIPGADAKKMGKIYDEIKDKYFDPETVEVMNSMFKTFYNDETMKGIIKLIDNVNTAFKGLVTIFYPSFHVRNLSTNVMNTAFAVGGNPLKLLADHKTALDFYKNFASKRLAGETVESLANKSIKEIGMTYNELFDYMVKSNLINTGFTKEMTGITGKFLDTKVGKVAGSIGNFIEDSSKAALMIGRLRKGDTLEEAANQVRKWLFDYSDLTDVEKNVFRRVIPFYTWTRKNLELQLTEMAHHPGRYANIFKGVRAVGGQADQGDTSNLPAWMREGFAIPVGGQTAEGEQKYITGLGTPLEAAVSAIQPKNILSSISPIFRITGELATGKNFFKGMDIGKDTSAYSYRNLPEPVKKILQIKEIKKSDGSSRYVMPANIKYALGSLPLTSRSLPTIAKLFNIGEGEAADILQVLSGIKASTLNMPEEKENRQREAEQRLYDILQSKGLANTYQRSYIPKDVRSTLAER